MFSLFFLPYMSVVLTNISVDKATKLHVQPSPQLCPHTGAVKNEESCK